MKPANGTSLIRYFVICARFTFEIMAADSGCIVGNVLGREENVANRKKNKLDMYAETRIWEKI